MDIKGLNYFIAAAERLNFTAAARECYITQTAMSLHISKMEDELGFSLFTRNNRVVELTQAGRDFLKQAKILVQSYDYAVRHSQSVASGKKGTINFMVPGCIEGFIFMDRFKLFISLYPDVELNIQVSPPDRLIGSLKSGKTDVGVGSPEDMELDPDLLVHRVREDTVSIICSKHHPLATAERVTSEMLKTETFIISAPTGAPNTYKMLRKGWIQSGFEPASILPVSNMDEMLLMIELERGIGLLPGFANERIDPKTAGVVFLACDYEGKPPTMTTAIGYMKENPNPVLKNFLEIFLS